MTSGRLVVLGVIAALVVPLAVAAVALRRPEWFPVLDLAMTELRVRDVGGPHTPLIGLPGRIGDFPDQGSHPGPLSFYALAPVYRALGSSTWALLVSTLVVNAVALTAAVLIAYRRGGWRLTLAVGVLLALLVRGYGIDTVSEPWNPNLPLLWWMVALLAVWSVLCRDVALLPVAVVAASMCAQTHVPYLGLSLGLAALVAGALFWQWRLATADHRRRIVRWAAVAVTAGVVLWLPPLLDQATRTPGNFSMLWDHFTTPPEEPVGLGSGVRLLLLHLDVWSFVTGGTQAAGSLVRASSDPEGSIAAGLVVFAVWAVASATAWRVRGTDREGRALVSLHLLVGSGLVLGAFSMGRIFGKVWYYLMLWAWGVTALLILAVVWTAVRVAASRLSPAARSPMSAIGPAALAVTLGILATTLVVRAVEVPPPAPRLSATLGELVGPTAAALDDGVGAATGREGRYVVRWSDAFYIGSQGYGLVNELERRGFDVGVPEPWRVPVTAHRVRPPAEATAQVHMATGFWIDRWRAVPDAVEVARHDPRTPAQRAEFERIRRQVLTDLEEAGLDDVAPLVDGNLFGATLDPRLPDETRERMERMLHLGLPAAVFLAPPGVDA